METMYELADKLYKDTMAAPHWPQKNEYSFDGTGFHLAFNVYPAAEAQSYVVMSLRQFKERTEAY